jgi:hypothetical protein
LRVRIRELEQELGITHPDPEVLPPNPEKPN